MTAIILIALQILFLILKSYFHRSDEKEKAAAALQSAQEKIDDLAQRFELKTRFQKLNKKTLNKFLDEMDKDQSDTLKDK
jgi:outer membrane lipoprotein-sorting protein